MGDAKSHTQRLKHEDITINFFLKQPAAPASLQRITLIASSASGRHYHSQGATFYGNVTPISAGMLAVPGMFSDLPGLTKNWLFLVYYE